MELIGSISHRSRNVSFEKGPFRKRTVPLESILVSKGFVSGVLARFDLSLPRSSILLDYVRCLTPLCIGKGLLLAVPVIRDALSILGSDVCAKEIGRSTKSLSLNGAGASNALPGTRSGCRRSSRRC